jgi:hypothetical protein
MVEQYPDTITVFTLPDSVRDTDGNWSTGAPVQSTWKCRAESSSSGVLTSVSGEKIQFSWIVYMPSGVTKVKEGSKVSIVNRLSEAVCEQSVLRFSRGQFNARIWL